MPDNFDDIIKDKLGGFESSFNPADWKNMEGMLPQDTRKPFLLLLLLALGIAGVMVATIQWTNERSFSPVTEVQQSYSSHRNNVSGPLSINVTGYSKAGSEYCDEKSANEKGIIDRENNVLRKKNDLGKSGNKLIRSQNQKTLPYINANTFPYQSSPTKKSSVISGLPEEEGLQAKASDRSGISRNNQTQVNVVNAGSDPADKSGSINHKKKKTAKGYNKENIQYPLNRNNTVANETDEILFIALATDKINSFDIDQINTNDPVPLNTSKEVPSVSKNYKQKIVTGLIGIGGGIDQNFTRPSTFTVPGYKAGFFEEIIFVNRIGLSFGQMFSSKTYNINHPQCSDSLVICPDSYQSTIKAIDLLIDVKANLVNKGNWTYYVKVGLQHSIKLKESFTYNYPDTFIINPPVTVPVLAGQNGFASNTELDALNSGRDNAIAINDFALSGSSRYHLSYHFATGFDYQIRKFLTFQFEVGYLLSHPKIGIQDKHLNSLGMDAKLFYRFGR